MGCPSGLLNSQDDHPGRTEAIHRLVELGLKAKGK